ncbi:UDP-galactose transporter 1 [Striga asiatica]|uniref:UDP-galactose transporter 1 n=1 Tax=Striga asiatica TaxID=4170 RepID=A0A5A7PZR5_STRAF|nr:UDP-galactose transporter 1 [Striga asiatica]
MRLKLLDGVLLRTTAGIRRFSESDGAADRLEFPVNRRTMLGLERRWLRTLVKGLCSSGWSRFWPVRAQRSRSVAGKVCWRPMKETEHPGKRVVGRLAWSEEGRWSKPWSPVGVLQSGNETRLAGVAQRRWEKRWFLQPAQT